MSRRSGRILILVVFGVVLFTGIFLLFRIIENKPPVEEIRKARESIEMANDKHADKYAGELLKNSVGLYDSAMYYWEQENSKFLLFRNYDRIRILAKQSAELSKQASLKATANSNVLKNELITDLGKLNMRITEFKSWYGFLPNESLWKQYNRGNLKYKEAKALFDSGHLFDSRKKLDEAKVIIDKCFAGALKNLKAVFEDYPEWQKITRTAISESRARHAYLVVVDKFARECFLYYKGEVAEKYQVELGKNWIGDKKHAGDLSTPEGLYKVTAKKEKNSTKYYKALLLDYPNEDDKKRFQFNKKKGVIGSNKTIGSLIEIHGHGGQGADWTSGCVALENDDMDRLYAKCPVGTPVVIVGSLKPLESLVR